MSNWLHNATESNCEKLCEIVETLQCMENSFIKANDEYYEAAQKAIDSKIEGATAFVAAVNTDINVSKYEIEGMGHVCSATAVLRAAIINSCQLHDEKLAAIANDHQSQVPQTTFERWRDQLITKTLRGVGVRQQLLDNVLRTGDTCIFNAWICAVKDEQPQVEKRFASAFNALARVIKSLLRDWAKEIGCQYQIFQRTLRNYKYLSARDLFSFIESDVDKTQDTDKPITITPYTTLDGKKGLLVTIAGTDIVHCWDNSVINALLTGEAGPDNPYMSALGDAIQKYMDEHPKMRGVDVTLVGYSQGAMIAQNWAKQLHCNQKTDLSRYHLDVKNVVIYGTPLMGPRVPGVQYAIYAAPYDPILLLSSYENHLLGDHSLVSLVEKLAQNPVNIITHFGDLAHAFPQLLLVYLSVVKADNSFWAEKLEYMDRDGQYSGEIFLINDVGNVPTSIPIIGHVLDLQNHTQYQHSHQLNSLATTQALPNIDPRSLGPTEYFGMYAPTDLQDHKPI